MKINSPIIRPTHELSQKTPKFKHDDADSVRKHSFKQFLTTAKSPDKTSDLESTRDLNKLGSNKLVNDFSISNSKEDAASDISKKLLSDLNDIAQEVVKLVLKGHLKLTDVGASRLNDVQDVLILAKESSDSGKVVGLLKSSVTAVNMFQSLIDKYSAKNEASSESNVFSNLSTQLGNLSKGLMRLSNLFEDNTQKVEPKINDTIRENTPLQPTGSELDSASLLNYEIYGQAGELKDDLNSIVTNLVSLISNGPLTLLDGPVAIRSAHDLFSSFQEAYNKDLGVESFASLAGELEKVSANFSALRSNVDQYIKQTGGRNKALQNLADQLAAFADKFAKFTDSVYSATQVTPVVNFKPAAAEPKPELNQNIP